LAGGQQPPISHQDIDQYPLPVRRAVFGNVGTLVAFGIDHSDAEVLERKRFRTFPAAALADLGRHEAVMKLSEDGTNWEPFRAEMLAPMENRVGRKEKLGANSRERFATPRATVETGTG